MDEVKNQNSTTLVYSNKIIIFDFDCLLVKACFD